MTINSNAYFETSIRREDPNNLKSNIITESFFDTGKDRSSQSYKDLVKTNNQESNMMKSIAASINQNIDRVKVRNVIQPMINEVQVPTPVPQPFPVTKTNTQIIPIDVSRGQNSLAKSIT